MPRGKLKDSLRSGTLKRGKKALNQLQTLTSEIQRLLMEHDSQLGHMRTGVGRTLNLHRELTKLMQLWEVTLENEPSKLELQLFLQDFHRNLVYNIFALKRLLTAPMTEENLHMKDKITIRIIYMYHELDAIFPNGVAISRYRFDQPEAGEWWSRVFSNQVSVSWPGFIQAFSSEFNFHDPQQIEKLNATINFTSEEYVSVFTWDIFSRLFAPWSMLIQTWKKLVFEHPGYLPWMTFEGIKKLLKQYKLITGTYAFRMSCTNIGSWAVAYVDHRGLIVQTICRSGPLADFLEAGKSTSFIYPVGSNTNTDLSELTKQVQKYRVDVEKLETYSTLESFLSCGICLDNHKNTQFAPCDHLVCANCAKRWLNKDNHCPFCRREVHSTRPISIAVNSAESDDENSSDSNPNSRPLSPKERFRITRNGTLPTQSSFDELPRRTNSPCVHRDDSPAITSPTSSRLNSRNNSIDRPANMNQTNALQKETFITPVKPNTIPRSLIRTIVERPLPPTPTEHQPTCFTSKPSSPTPQQYNRSSVRSDKSDGPSINRNNTPLPPTPALERSDESNNTRYLPNYLPQGTTPGLSLPEEKPYMNANAPGISIEIDGRKNPTSPYMNTKTGADMQRNGTGVTDEKINFEDAKLKQLSTKGNWSETEARRALRVAGGNVKVAENILREYVG